MAQGAFSCEAIKGHVEDGASWIDFIICIASHKDSWMNNVRQNFVEQSHATTRHNISVPLTIHFILSLIDSSQAPTSDVQSHWSTQPRNSKPPISSFPPASCSSSLRHRCRQEPRPLAHFHRSCETLPKPPGLHMRARRSITTNSHAL